MNIHGIFVMNIRGSFSYEYAWFFFLENKWVPVREEVDIVFENASDGSSGS